MTPTDAAKLCVYVEQCCPQQRINEFTADVWGDLLADTRYSDALVAVKALGQRVPFIDPAAIIAEVGRSRAARLTNIAQIQPPATWNGRPFDPDTDYIPWQRDLRTRLADGEPVPEPVELPARRMPELARTFRRTA
jgi:hypothetical protein